ncbi:hypothetical protein Pcinc_042774 [Petrolisthes cinctipes]|uniref:Uncharacterized protein n=1 Tax=Petrolisthes cinctipes TaxID=88211 RepID=A0AAE1EFL2_PETCI|nr:hypothetical protein Pcinc_042774 [Petrolisthes cinctipes]
MEGQQSATHYYLPHSEGMVDGDVAGKYIKVGVAPGVSVFPSTLPEERALYCTPHSERKLRTVKIMRCLLLLSILAWVSVIGEAQPPQQQQVRDDDVGEGVVNEEENMEKEEEEGVVLDPEWYIQGCRYYCIYSDLPYCCDDGSLPLPDNHNLHENLTCPPWRTRSARPPGYTSSTVLPGLT